MPRYRNFYPRSPCGERLLTTGPPYSRYNFYPRSPCGERPKNTRDCVTLRKFLSTLSLRRATKRCSRSRLVLCHFYPRSPCGERLIPEFSGQTGVLISIHALLAESDTSSVRLSLSGSTFLSTLSLRRATTHHFPTLHNILISIHALLAESDPIQANILKLYKYFYPRSPCGERQQVKVLKVTAHSISIHALLEESDSKSAQNRGALLRI